MAKNLIMYTRTAGCPFVSMAKRVLNDYAVDYQEVFIDKDDEARRRVLDWTGFLAVPTLVIAQADSILPFEDPAPLAKGASPRGINRGSMLTEPNMEELAGWLRQHGIISAEAAD